MASLRVSKTSFLVGTRSLALSPDASVSDIRSTTYLQFSWTRVWSGVFYSAIRAVEWNGGMEWWNSGMTTSTDCVL